MTHSDEIALRDRLGIPDDAERVIIFAESSHWDPNWLVTADEYYHRYVEANLDQAIEALEREPRRVYGVECVFFLRMYWERRPDRQEMVRRLVNEERLRLTSSGVTTADTLLPSSEAILRDFLVGQEWLRQNGMTQEPRLAYFTDSFGCSPALPSLLRAAGFDRTAITRIDGMYFVGCDLEGAKNFPRPGSSAARLLEVEKSLDFVWRDMNGAQVLCHWNAYTYFQGDLLAHRGITRIYMFPLAVADRSERNVARRVGQFVRQLAPYSRTPYLFCPMGIDFVAPDPDLVRLLDRYNRVRYPTTGVWAVNAGLDDYLALVDCHRAALPVVELDPNPYWTGFYTARPALKRRCRDLVDHLLLAEWLALFPELGELGPGALQELEAAWWDAVVANHHDFITGTSPDPVVEEEQLPWLERAMETVERVVQRLAASLPQTSLPSTASVAERSGTPEKSVGLRRRDGGVQIETLDYAVDLSAEAGGCISHAWGVAAERQPGLTGISNDLISYRDSGGLWRMGHEYRGGHLKLETQASQQRAPLQIFELDGGTEVVCDVYLDGQAVRRSLWFRDGVPLIFGRVEGRAARRRTIALLFNTGISTSQIAMAQPGGVVARSPRKLYDPTFWPLQGFAHLQDETNGRGVAFFVNAPSAIAYREDGRVELIALRNATRERAFGVIPLLANPASGYERESTAFEYAILFTSQGDWRANRLSAVAHELLNWPWESTERSALRARAASVVTVDGPGPAPVEVAATTFKPASRGEGLILRLSALHVPAATISIALRGRSVQSAFLCDARERDLEPLVARDGRVYVTMPGSIATLRLLVQ